MILKEAVLKSPQDYAGTAAVIAFWIQCNVSLTSMEMITVERALELKDGKLWADDIKENNKWGLFKEQISLVGNEAKRLYKLQRMGVECEEIYAEQAQGQHCDR